jgi:ABC-type oligopeptide transport system substrate-binding subunit
MAGSLTTGQARALWSAMPLAIQGLLDHAPDLLDTMVPMRPLLARAEAALPAGHPLLHGLAERASKESVAGNLEQPQLFEQAVQLLHHLAKEQPLLIILDDLQWADSGSIALLFHLGRRLAGSRILVLGAYRQDEVSAEAEHPLRPLLDEFRRAFGDVWLDLNQAPGRGFVDAIIDSEANRLDEGFRETLFQRTSGHPLFTVELLRDMQERGDLVQDEEGAWMVGPELNWEALPARVEGAIAARIGRLEEDLRDILAVAAVEGETFTAQVVARVQEKDERRLLQSLSRELEMRHRLVRERSAVKVGRLLLSRYRFSHALFQQYLYNNLSDGERRMLHRDIAVTLEELYDGRTGEIAVQLARHFVEAGEDDKALPYLLQAGDRARLLYAFEEATRQYERALTILKEAGDFERASRILMKLALTYHSAFDYERSRQAYEEGFVLGRMNIPRSGERVLPLTPHTLRLNVNWFVSLEPGMYNTADLSTIFNQLFSGLVTLTPELDIIPDVARSWEIQDGGRTYIFHLRNDVRWSDGQPVTAGDFAYAWRRALDPELGSWGIAPLFYDIVDAAAFHRGDSSDLGIKALDDWSLRVELEKPAGYFLQLLAINAAYPVPRHVVEDHGNAWAEPGNFVSNGPFRLVSWDRDAQLNLERNPDYHGRFAGNVDHVEISTLTNPELYISLYEADEIDILRLNWISPQVIHEAALRNASDYLTWPQFGTHMFRFDTSRPPFDDRRVRQALAQAVDKHQLATVNYLGQASPASGGLVPPGMPGHVPGIAWPFDPEAARDLLAEAGYPGGRNFPLAKTLVGRRDSYWMDPVLDQWISELSIEFHREYVEYYADWSREGVPHIHGFGWLADNPDPDNFLRVSPHAGNVPELVLRWQTSTFDDLLNKARQLQDQKERMALYRQAEEILVEEVPIIPILHQRMHILVKPWIKNIRQSGYTGFVLKDIIIEPH